MALAPVLSEAITATAVPTWGLFAGGGPNVLKSGVVGSFGVERGTVEVIEAGPGGVSSMTFDIDDPAIAVTVSDGMDIRFWDITNGIPVFTGWVQSWSYVPDFGNQGRIIRVRCIGAEALLDWAILLSNITVNVGDDPAALAQSLVAASTATGPLRAFSSVSPGGSSQATPIASNAFFGACQAGLVISAGVTLRQALDTLAGTLLPGSPFPVRVTVDAYYGLRMYVNTTLDWTTLTINDAIAGPILSEGLGHEVDASGIVRGVYVVGGNAAGTGFVSDGTGLPGPVAVLSNPNILTAAAMTAAGTTYLLSFALGNRGTFRLEDHAASTTVHAGGVVVITDARVGVAAAQYPIGSIRKTFNAVRQTWEVSYGGMAPSAMRSVRRLTRGTLS